MNNMSMIRVKELLSVDEGFRSRFPDLKSRIDEFLKDTSCPCHASLYKEIAERINNNAITPPAISSRFSVINCEITELEKELRKIPFGSIVEGISRFQNEITCVVRIKE